MKNFNRTYLVEQISYNGETYTYKPNEQTDPLKKHICVSILSRNLKGKTDLLNRQYTANKFIYTN